MRRLTRWTAGVTAVVLAAAACSSTVTKITTAGAVDTAFKSDFDQPSISIQVSLDLTAGQISQLLAAAGKKGAPAGAASGLAGSTIDIDEVSGHGEDLSSAAATTDDDNSYELAFTVNGSNPIDLRIVGRTVYLRADLGDLASDFGQDQKAPGLAQSFASDLRALNSFVPGVSGLANGGWVKAPFSAFEPLISRLKAEEGSRSTSVSQSGVRKLVSEIESAFDGDTTFVNLGDHGGRTEYKMTTSLKTFLNQVDSSVSSMSTLFGAATSTIEGDMTKDIAKLPSDQTVVADLWVLDNKVQEIDVDLKQFVPKLAVAAPLRILISSGIPVVAPAGATNVNLSNLPDLFGPSGLPS